MRVMTLQTGGSRGPYRAGVERRRAIIDQAAGIFAESGFYGGTMRDVAARVGVTPAALSRYFAGKEDLFLAVMEHHLGEWRAYIDRTAGPDRRGLAYFRGVPRVLEYFTINPGIGQLQASIMAEGVMPDHPAHAYVIEGHDATQASFERHLLEAVESGEVPRFSAAEVRLEAAQLSLMLRGGISRVALEVSLPPGVIVPSTVEIFTAYIDATIARWKAAAALVG